MALLERRTTDGLSERDIIRCIKRYIAREIYNDIHTITRTNTTRTTHEIAA
jgi:transposase